MSVEINKISLFFSFIRRFSSFYFLFFSFSSAKKLHMWRSFFVVCHSQGLRTWWRINFQLKADSTHLQFRLRDVNLAAINKLDDELKVGKCNFWRHDDDWMFARVLNEKFLEIWWACWQNDLQMTVDVERKLVDANCKLLLYGISVNYSRMLKLHRRTFRHLVARETCQLSC